MRFYLLLVSFLFLIPAFFSESYAEQKEVGPVTEERNLSGLKQSLRDLFEDSYEEKQLPLLVNPALEYILDGAVSSLSERMADDTERKIVSDRITALVSTQAALLDRKDVAEVLIKAIIRDLSTGNRVADRVAFLRTSIRTIGIRFAFGEAPEAAPPSWFEDLIHKMNQTDPLLSKGRFISLLDYTGNNKAEIRYLISI